MDKPQSSFAGISVRAWIAVLLTLTVCLVSGLGRDAGAVVNNAFLVVIGFYFGARQSGAVAGKAPPV